MADFSWVPKELEGRFTYVNNKLMANCEVCGAQRHTSGRGAVLRDLAAGVSEKFRFCNLHGTNLMLKPTKQDIASWPKGHKRCCKCKQVLAFNQFHKHKNAMFGFNTVCKSCRKPIAKKSWSEKSFEQSMWESAKRRARESGRRFEIELSDIFIPEKCPVLGVPIVLERNHPHAPSLDRINSAEGYIKGNVIVMSKKGNTYKNEMNVDQAKKVLAFLESMENCLRDAYGGPFILGQSKLI